MYDLPCKCGSDKPQMIAGSPDLLGRISQVMIILLYLTTALLVIDDDCE